MAASIRRATEKDAELIAEIIRHSFQDVAECFALTLENCPKHPSNCTTEWIEWDQARGVEYFILSQGGESIGCVGLESPSPDLCYLERLAVLPGRRHQGLGRALVLHALTYAKGTGASTVSIGIIAAHAKLKHWYAALGFKERETKSFPQLPFRVCFMEFDMNGAANKALGATLDSAPQN